MECVFHAHIALNQEDLGTTVQFYEQRKFEQALLNGKHWEDDSCEKCGQKKIPATRTFVGL